MVDVLLDKSLIQPLPIAFLVHMIAILAIIALIVSTATLSKILDSSTVIPSDVLLCWATSTIM